jgi:glutathione S-transferase
MAQKSEITLYFLQASRSIRIAWLLEELGLEYKSVFFPRENNKAPADFKSQSGNTLGKAPCLKDGGLTIGESGAITEYVSLLSTEIGDEKAESWAGISLRNTTNPRN